MQLDPAKDTRHLLRPSQIQEANEEIAHLEGMLNAPPHIAGRISDRGGMVRRLRTLKRETEEQSPKPYAERERDAALREFDALGEAIKEGMPSSEEMRRNPPGAVGRNIAWQKRTKKAVARFKHIAMRLLAGGDVPAHLRHAGDIANVERLRPWTTPQQLSMDGAQIPKTADFHLGEANSVVLSDEEIEQVKAVDPEIEKTLALLSGDQRAAVKEMLRKMVNGAAPAQAESTPEEEKFAPMKLPSGRPTKAASHRRMLETLAKRNNVDSFGRTNEAIEADLKAKGIET